MKPEKILQSDVIDIIFEDRNKAYGAYTLRKNYNHRLIQALGGTVALVGLFVLLQSMKSSDEVNAPIIPPYRELGTVELPKDKPEEKKPEEKPRQKAAPQPTVQYVEPVIVKDPPDKALATIDDLDGKIISNVTNDVPPVEGGEPPLQTGDGDGKIINDPPAAVVVEPTIYEHADVMPSFNGDVRNFMLRHLRQPDDIEAGERIVVRVKFVVNEEGNISDIQVIQSGRADLDAEVVRVIRKMPKWNPGMQGGRNVPVFFSMPVTFVNNAE